MNERELRQTLLDIVARLEARGFNHGSSGNVSCRVGDNILITSTGGNSSNMTVDGLVHLKRDGTVV